MQTCITPGLIAKPKIIIPSFNNGHIVCNTHLYFPTGYFNNTKRQLLLDNIGGKSGMSCTAL